MKSISDYFTAVNLSKISLPALIGLIGSLVSLFIGTVAFIKGVEFLNNHFFREDRIVLEIQQDLQENQFFSIWLKGVSDKSYLLDSLKFRTPMPAKMKLQYDDLKIPITLAPNPNLISYSYTVSKEELEKLSNQKNLTFESQKPLSLFVEFEQVVDSPKFTCQFTGIELDPTLSNPKSQSIECGVEELGYVSVKDWKRRALYGVAGVLILLLMGVFIWIVLKVYRTRGPI